MNKLLIFLGDLIQVYRKTKNKRELKPEHITQVTIKDLRYRI